MKLPHFHLATLLVASLVLAVFVGTNLIRRWSVRVDFTNLKGLTDNQVVSKHGLYSCYKHRVFELGWPAPIAASPDVMVHVDIFNFDQISAVEKQELERLKAFDGDAYFIWDGKDVERLAPTVYASMPNLDKEMPPGYIHPTWDFLPSEDAGLLSTNKPAIALNTAVALAITLALAAACEFFFRHKKKTPPTG